MPYQPGFGKTEAFPREPLAEYKIGFYTAAPYNMTPQEARRQIKYKLDNHNAIVNTSPVDKNNINNILNVGGGGVFTEELVTSMIHSGLVWVRGHVDGTNNTGDIKVGQPVVFDSVSGKCVTGINENWGPEEYKIVGIAWKDLLHQGVTQKVSIPIKLCPDTREIVNYAGKMYEPLAFESHARVIVYTYDYTMVDEIQMKDTSLFPILTDRIIDCRDWFLHDVSKTIPTGTNVGIVKWGSKWYVNQAKC